MFRFYKEWVRNYLRLGRTLAFHKILSWIFLFSCSNPRELPGICRKKKWFNSQQPQVFNLSNEVCSSTNDKEQPSVGYLEHSMAQRVRWLVLWWMKSRPLWLLQPKGNDKLLMYSLQRQFSFILHWNDKMASVFIFRNIDVKALEYLILFTEIPTYVQMRQFPNIPT